jgi:hypothetical protein
MGCNYDGGYIISDIPNVNYDILIAGGIAGDISFEADLCEKYKIKCIGFDGTSYCTVKNDANPNIEIISKNIGDSNSENTTDLKDIIGQYNNIFVKMDIEGFELPWVRCLTEEQLNKFSQIVMEFHFPFSDDDKIVFEKLNKNHVLVHFHGNNCPAGTINFKGIIIPNVFECTYINKKYVNLETLELNDEVIPGKLDMPNCHGKDIFIDYVPFVNKK